MPERASRVRINLPAAGPASPAPASRVRINLGPSPRPTDPPRTLDTPHSPPPGAGRRAVDPSAMLADLARALDRLADAADAGTPIASGVLRSMAADARGTLLSAKPKAAGLG